MSSTEDLEKGGNDGDASGSPPEHGREHHHQHEREHGDHHIHIPHHPGKRLKQWARDDGRKIHIAHTPEEEVKLRNHLSVSEPKEEFDIYIHGSPEHLDAIRELHAQHEQRRDDLRDQHGEIYDEFEHVRMELDALNTELHMLTEHGVALEANFSKFGYSAHLRTKDGDSPSSSTTTLNGDHSFSHETHDWDEERNHGQQLVFWKRPVVRQYFHKGLLWRASSREEVGSFELFVDLLYVGIIGVVGDVAAEHATGDAFLKFSIIFIIGWKIWSDLTLIVSWFETDDIFQRLSVMFIMICLFGYTTNIAYAFEDSPEGTYTSLIAFFLTQRLFAGAYLLWVAYLIPMIRGTMWATCLLVLISSSLWIGSIHVAVPSRYALIWLAIPLDIVGHVPITLIMRASQKSTNPGWIAKNLGKHFEFYPAVNIEHKTERTNAFVTLVFGYSVLAIIYQSHSAFGINAFFGKAILGLIQAFAFNWIYFEIDGFNLHVHAIRRHFFSAFLWIAAHLPFIMGYVLAAATMSRLILAHDCRDAHVGDLGEAFIPKSEEAVSDGLRWFYCGGLGAALACMSLISLSHVHKKIPNQRLPKRPRMIFRFCVSVVIICLPLAKSFTSLSLMGTTCSLVVIVLSTDLYGNSCTGTSFFEGFLECKKRRRYTYSAECKVRRRMLREKAKRGETVTLDELISGDTNQKAGGVELLQ